ncbi:UNVERIFIED_CONTAM: hypothetical protein PYX00_011363 [Menopon gallinae]|uniref:fructose-bisphosphate aldolase n=1 Tax=Menopon gallinae TaxID=328185 RepID=A0AAW2H783_9NEOP
MVEDGKGILAADEKGSSLEKRFGMCGIINTEENRRKFRELVFKAAAESRKIGGVILNEETFGQSDDTGKSLVDILIEHGILVGVKLDKGLIEFGDSEQVSVGLEDLDHRCKEPAFAKADFTKWRSVFKVSATTPTRKCIEENCAILAEYAEISQKNNMVPIVEPEILWDGDYSAEKAAGAQKVILSTLIQYLNARNVYTPGVIVKTSFVTSGCKSGDVKSPKDVGMLTFHVLLDTIPCGISGVVFLSGGHTPEEATEYLKCVSKERGRHTWPLSFSFGRALTDPFLSKWMGKDENIEEARQALLKKIDECFSAVGTTAN